MREAMQQEGTARVFPAEVREVLVYTNITLGGLITSGYCQPRDIVHIHAALTVAGRESES